MAGIKTKVILVLLCSAILPVAFLGANLFSGLSFYEKLIAPSVKELKGSKFEQFSHTDQKTLLKGYQELGLLEKESLLYFQIATNTQDPNDLTALTIFLLKNPTYFSKYSAQLELTLLAFAKKNLSEYALPKGNPAIPVQNLHFLLSLKLAGNQESAEQSSDLLWRLYQKQIHFEDYDITTLAKLGYTFLQYNDHAKADTCFRIFFERSPIDTVVFEDSKIIRKIPRKTH